MNAPKGSPKNASKQKYNSSFPPILALNSNAPDKQSLKLQAPLVDVQVAQYTNGREMAGELRIPLTYGEVHRSVLLVAVAQSQLFKRLLHPRFIHLQLARPGDQQLMVVGPVPSDAARMARVPDDCI